MRRVFAGVLLCVAIFAVAVSGQQRDKIEIVVPAGYQPLKLESSPELQALLKSAVDEVIAAHQGHEFKPEEIAATLIDL